MHALQIGMVKIGVIVVIQLQIIKYYVIGAVILIGVDRKALLDQENIFGLMVQHHVLMI